MGGLKLLESIKRLNPAMPVVMMTAFGSIPDAVEAMRQGAYDYVTKPFTAGHIVHVVARALEVHELRSENKELRDRIESLTEPGAVSHAQSAFAKTCGNRGASG